jgi:DNA-binding FrmR family transcriptional regulator
MTKQDYLLAVINAMPDWEMGRGIKAMIENNQLEENTIDLLVAVFRKTVEKMADIIKKHHLLEAIDAIENLNTQKSQQAKQDKSDLEKLDGMLNDF